MLPVLLHFAYVKQCREKIVTETLEIQIDFVKTTTVNVTKIKCVHLCTLSLGKV